MDAPGLNEGRWEEIALFLFLSGSGAGDQDAHKSNLGSQGELKCGKTISVRDEQLGLI